VPGIIKLGSFVFAIRPEFNIRTFRKSPVEPLRVLYNSNDARNSQQHSENHHSANIDPINASCAQWPGRWRNKGMRYNQPAGEGNTERQNRSIAF
jgi:hypothetical protein